MTSVQRASDDYRASHTGREKAVAYDRRFTGNPHRAMMWAMERDVLDHIVRDFLGGRVSSYLDFACGTGRIVAHVEQYADSAAGVDVSADMLELARARVRRAELFERDLTRSSCFVGRSFQLVTAFRFFPNAQPELRREVMAVLASLLDKDGYLVFNNHLNASSLMLRAARLLRASRGLGMTQAAAHDVIRNAGLKVVKEYHLGISPSNERIMLAPRAILEPFERFAAKRSMFRALSQNIIYVCQKSAGSTVVNGGEH